MSFDLDSLGTAAQAIAPWGAWLAASTAALFLLLLCLRWIRRARASRPRRRRETALLVAALAFTSLVLLAYMIGTYEGAIAYARDQLGWRDWRQVIPWAALDAASIGFSLFAVRAVALTRSPRAAKRVVYLSAAFSALMQLVQGGSQHRWQAGLFLAFLAGLSATMLHTVIDQLRATDDADDLRHLRAPAFGMRWLTSPGSTTCAWLAWWNYPVTELPTVLAALANLQRVRQLKLDRSVERERVRGRAPWWSALVPGMRSRRLSVLLRSVRTERERTETELRTAVERAERAARELRTETERSVAVLTERHHHLVERLRAEHDAALERAHADRQAAEDLLADAEHRHAMELGAVRDATERGAVRPFAPHRAAPRPPTGGGTPRSELSDDDAVHVLHRVNPDSDAWTQRAVRARTGAGFGRIPRLLQLLREHRAATCARCAAEDGDGDGDSERRLAAV